MHLGFFVNNTSFDLFFIRRKKIFFLCSNFHIQVHPKRDAVTNLIMINKNHSRLLKHTFLTAIHQNTLLEFEPSRFEKKKWFSDLLLELRQ